MHTNHPQQPKTVIGNFPTFNPPKTSASAAAIGEVEQRSDSTIPMGRRGRGSRTQRKHFKENRENVWKKPKTDPSAADPSKPNGGHPAWKPFATENPAFDEYYKEQGIVAPEEWDAFMEMLRKPLPAAFRINSSGQFAEEIKSILENDFMKSLEAEAIEGGELVAMKPLPWYPDNLGWHSNFSRMQIRKNKTLERFHEFLKLANEIGNITRQEAVSMVPPLFLDVNPDHFVLDMCAAPGSKTFQLLEIIHHKAKPGSLPNGMVLANDLDVQRCNLLIHQTKRMCTANLIVTNHEAQHFPGCRLKQNSSRGLETMSESECGLNQLLFDRVLCDVPCSGDGTLRKAPDLWRKWNPGMGCGLHGLQVLIAMRGLALLKVGGRMVYSTCSMNPVENEAVVAEVLRRCGGSVELLDVSGELPQLIRRPGLKTWKVRDKGVWFASFKDVSITRKGATSASMFPSGKTYAEKDDSKEEEPENGATVDSEKEVSSSPTEDSSSPINELEVEVSDLPLERCMRIVPHDQNTGSFFIAVLHKRSPLPALQEKTTAQGKKSNGNDELLEKLSNQAIEDTEVTEVDPEDATGETISEAAASEVDLVNDGVDEAAIESNPSEAAEESNPSEAAEEPAVDKTETEKSLGKRKLQIQGKWRGVDPVIFFKDETIINRIKEFYGIDDAFPFKGHLVSRNNDNNHVKRIYYISKSVKDVLHLNFQVGQQLKITSIGIKMFERQTSKEGAASPCLFRISSEGLPVILPYIRKQILYAAPRDFKHLLQYKGVKFGDFVDTEFGQMAANLLMGCCVIVLRDSSKTASDPMEVDASTIAIGCWKGKVSLSVMVTALDCQELLERLTTRMGETDATPGDEIIMEPEQAEDVNGVEKDMETEPVTES